MTINPDLYRAILAMDAYNRGYNAGIGELGGLNSFIGTAKIIETSSALGAGVDESASFYAVAYDWNGQTVISYRGTDNLAGGYLGLLTGDFFNADVWNGYGIGAGFTDGAQAKLA